MNKWLLVSFYTKNTGYEKLGPAFKQSAVDAGIDEMIIDIIPNQKNWHKNTRRKALVVYQHLGDLDGSIYDAVVFVDIDARFYSYPKLFDEITEDFGAHFRNWRHGQNELLSGTLFFRINKHVRDLVEDWIRLNKQKPNIWEQRNLQRAVRRHAALSIHRLPIEYCTIFDDEKRKMIKPVIEHFQASRKLRFEVNK